jgi:hypothetical protein
MAFQIGTMSVGDILDRGLKLLLGRLPVFYAINLIVLVPIILLQLAFPYLIAGQSPQFLALAALGWMLVVVVLTAVIQPLATAAILYVISQEFVGKHPDIGEAFRFAFRRFGLLLGTSILAGLVIMGGMFLCVVPGIIFFIWYVFVAQVVVVEGLGGSGALSRSKELSVGYRGRLIGLLALFIGMNIVLGIAAGMLNRVLPSQELVFTDKGLITIAHHGNQAIQTLVTQLINILVQTYNAICLTLLYFDLRIRKEGFDLELAAREQATIIS